MRTKIVYILSSDEQDIYLEQTLLSAFSLRRHNPNVVVELIVDQRTDQTIVGGRKQILQYVNQKIVVNVPEKYNKKQTSRFLKTTIRQHVVGDFLYIDSDTVITDRLDGIDSFDGPIGAVINAHVPISQHYNKYGHKIRECAKRDGWKCSDDIKFFNSGVIYVKDTETTHQFFSDWHVVWVELLEKYGEFQDQPSLASVNENHHYLIRELSGIWNCQVVSCFLPFLHEAKIIHYFTIGKDYKTKMIYRFRDKSIYLTIREKGIIPDDLIILVDNAKTAFVNPVRLCLGNEQSLLAGEMAQFCLIHPRIEKIMNAFFRILKYLVK